MPTLAEVTPALSIQPWNFAAQNPGEGGWRHLLAQAQAADAAGIDRLVVSDHVVLGENLAAYADPKSGGTEGGQQPTGPEGHWLDPLVVLSMWAAATQRVRLMTAILIAGLRRPANLAKQTATLDVTSEGRLDLGVSVGWQREEYEANGVPWEARGARLDATLEIMQALWRDEPAAYQGAEVQFSRIHCNPKPLQPGGVPLWIGGTLNRNVLRRIARFGSGWIPWGPDAANPAAGLAHIKDALAAEGRSAEGFQVTSYLPVQQRGGAPDIPATVAAAGPMAEAGITDMRVTLALPRERAAAEDMLAPLVQAFRREVGRA